MKTLTTPEAAARLKITPRRVRALIGAGQLPADKKGRDYFIDPKDLALVKNRKPGRPRGSSKEKPRKKKPSIKG
ncbi:MAG: helix-turn-helix domain-containing protein [Blastocatellia bacterium]|nr:helix-turn-helix domain-containing protein [Blastocatellia bacterium]